MQRGHNRLPCFIDGDDFGFFRDVLKESATRYDCGVDALLILPDSYWTLLVPSTDDGLSLTVQRAGRLYVRHTNRKYRRLGTLWAERYRACPIEPDSPALQRVATYLADLPRRKGVLSAGASWPWWDSSLPSVAAEGEPGPGAEAVREIETALRGGLVLGSPEFLSWVEGHCNQPAGPRRRGRPRTTS